MNNYWNNEEYNRVHGPNKDAPDAASDGTPTRTPGDQLATMAMFMGISSIITTFCMPVIAPGILSSLSIILAVISRGRDPQPSKASRTALRVGIAGLIVYLGFIGITGFTAYRVVSDPGVREHANETMIRMYGYSLDDLLNAIDENYGTSLAAGSMEDA